MEIKELTSHYESVFKEPSAEAGTGTVRHARCNGMGSLVEAVINKAEYKQLKPEVIDLAARLSAKK